MGPPVYGRRPAAPRGRRGPGSVRPRAPPAAGRDRLRKIWATLQIDIRALADAIGYPAAGLGILIESAGIPFPGETMLLAVAAYAAQGRLDIRLVVVLGAVGALLGANLGYGVGYLGGRPFVRRMGRLLRIGPSHFARSELFFARYGGLTILFARFVIGLRTWASVMAGMSPAPVPTLPALRVHRSP